MGLPTTFVNNCEVNYFVDFQMSSSVQLHHELFRHAANMPQKVALMLDMQMLSFAEVWHYVQTVAIHLIKEPNHLGLDEIVYQMLQRSVEFPIGYFAILAAGGVYCALDPMDSSDRNDKLIDQTRNARCIIVQEGSKRSTYVYLTDYCSDKNILCIFIISRTKLVRET